MRLIKPAPPCACSELPVTSTSTALLLGPSRVSGGCAGLSEEGVKAQEYVGKLSTRVRRLAERAESIKQKKVTLPLPTNMPVCLNSLLRSSHSIHAELAFGSSVTRDDLTSFTVKCHMGAIRDLS